MIKLGYTGTLVEEIQKAVGIRPDGYYNEKTTRAVRAWQLARGLPATGEVDELTWAALFPPAPAKEQPAPTTPVQLSVEVVSTTPEPVVEQSNLKPTKDGPKENQADTTEVNGILSGGGNKISNRPPSHSR
jgi:peptidoglycan hydrolase-like protein with peptidoglycan-binding domain